jgi:hypothetical protein
MLAPGDGEAEPGVTATKVKEPAKLATDAKLEFFDESKLFFLMFHLSPTSWAGPVLRSLPQARLRHRLGLALFPPASQARWMIAFTNIDQRAKTRSDTFNHGFTSNPFIFAAPSLRASLASANVNSC